MKQLLIIILLLISTPPLFGQWVLQNSGTKQNLTGVSFVDANNGWVAGDSGTILHTTDGGVSWINQTNPLSNTGLTLENIAFVNINEGWVVGGNMILRTTNGGSTWRKSISGILDNFALYDLSFVDNKRGWAVGFTVGNESPVIVHTTNGGISWVSQNAEYNNQLFAVSFVDSNNGCACGSGYIHCTTNSGSQWVGQSHPSTASLYGIFFKDSNNGWAVGEFSEILHTSNGGNTWEIQYLDSLNGLDGVFFNDINTGWAVGGGGAILYTTNSGAKWVRQISPTSNALHNIIFTDSRTGWSVGISGTILHTKNSGTSRVVDSELKNDAFSFMTNFPNPLTSSTTFNYTIPKTSFVTMRIMNALGGEVSRLVSEIMSEGAHEVKWDAHDMPNGIYFCQLRAGEYSQSVQVIVAK